MAYIPPHLRVSTSRPKPPDTLPPPFVKRPQPPRRKSARFSSRLIVLSCTHVEFAKFDGDTFAHLQKRQRYTLKAATIDNANASQDSYELSLQEQPARLIVGALQEDYQRFLEKLNKKFHKDGSPFMWLMFGKVLFHGHSNLQVEWHKSFMPKDVEMMGGLSKRFDNSISSERFSFLHEFAHRNSSKSWSKERYTIQILDEATDTYFWCVCAHSNGDEHSSLSSKTPAKSALTMIKIRLSPIGYMASDVACIGKSNDIRLVFFIKMYHTGLSEEELQDLESCLSKASVDHTLKGGLRWPLGSRQSTSGRFKVVGNVHDKKTNVVTRRDSNLGISRGGLRWSLQQCNRVEFEPFSGRISYEVAVRPRGFCKAQEEPTVEKLMYHVANVIQQVYDECIES